MKKNVAIVHLKCIRNMALGDVMKEALSKAIDALESSSWIPVTERLPDKMGSYITTINCGKYGFATGQRYFFNDEIGWNDKDVIAWMPLPEPYTKEETT